jgi:hypothetical protein
MDSQPYDLTTVSLVKEFLPAAGTNPADDDEIQILISACSQYAHDLTGRSFNPSSLTSINQYTEIRNGNGAFKLFTKDWPITQIISVTVNGTVIPISAGYNVAGALIDSTYNDAIVIVPSGVGTFTTQFPGWFGPLKFLRGIMNVQLVYKAGFATTPIDLQEAISRLVGQQLMRRQHIDESTKGVSVGGAHSTTAYMTKMFAEPWVERVLWKYTRVSALR